MFNPPSPPSPLPTAMPRQNIVAKYPLIGHCDTVQDVQCAMFCVQYMSNTLQSVFSPGNFRCSVYYTLFSVLCSAQLIVHCLLSGAPFALECLALCAVQLCRVHSVLAV